MSRYSYGRILQNIGDTLKKNYPGTNAWFITGNVKICRIKTFEENYSTPVLKLD
jgi:hypothetical protein